MCSRVSRNDWRSVLWQSLWAVRSVFEPSCAAKLGWYTDRSSKVPDIASMGRRSSYSEPLHRVSRFHGLYGNTRSWAEKRPAHCHPAGLSRPHLELQDCKGDCKSGSMGQRSDSTAFWILQEDYWVLEKTRNEGETCEPPDRILCEQMGTLEEDQSILGEHRWCKEQDFSHPTRYNWAAPYGEEG